MDKKFIKTSSLETVAILQKLGFQQIDENNGIYTFLNDGKLLFEKGMDIEGVAMMSYEESKRAGCSDEGTDNGRDKREKQEEAKMGGDGFDFFF